MKPSRKTGLRPAGLRKLWCLALICAVVAMVVPSIVAAAEDDPFPVWWSPVLELDSLDSIDARLERAVWKGDSGGMPLYKHDGDSYDSDARTEAWADSCNALMTLTEAGYEGLGSSGRKLEFLNLAYCRAIAMLKQAVPAHKSYLRHFVLNEGAIDYLPAMVFITLGCDYLCRQRLANERRIPLSRFENVLRIDSTNDIEMRIRTRAFESRISVLARGDFNADGLDEMLVVSNAHATEGRGSWTDLHLLTRDAPGAVLYVLNTSKTFCRDYQCDQTYDYPEVLSEPGAGRPN